VEKNVEVVEVITAGTATPIPDEMHTEIAIVAMINIAEAIVGFARK